MTDGPRLSEILLVVGLIVLVVACIVATIVLHVREAGRRRLAQKRLEDLARSTWVDNRRT